MEKRAQAVGCFLIFQNTFLLLHRVPHSYQGGKWGLVGGKVERDETAVEALYREAQEEIGLEMISGATAAIGTYPMTYPDQTWDFHVFVYQLENAFVPQLHPEEHSDYAWVTFEDAQKHTALMPGIYQLLENNELTAQLVTFLK